MNDSLGALLNDQAVLEGANLDVPQHTPTLNVEEVQKNKSLWRELISKARTDPGVKAAILQTGISMMRSQQPGQTGWDVVSNALQGGLGAFQNQRAQAETTARQGRQDALETKKVEGSLRNAELTSRTYAKATDQQAENARLKMALETILAPRKVAAEETKAGAASKQADAAIIRANKPNGGAVSAKSTMVSERAKALRAKNPALSEEDALLQAQNDLIINPTKGNQGNTPASVFRSLLQNRQKDLNMLDKSITDEELNQMLETARKASSKLVTPSETPPTPGSGAGQPQAQAAPGTAPGNTLFGRSVKTSDGGVVQIVGEFGDNVTIAKPDGSTAVVPKSLVMPHLVE